MCSDLDAFRVLIFFTINSSIVWFKIQNYIYKIGNINC